MQKVYRWENFHKILDSFFLTYDRTLRLTQKKSLHLSYSLSYRLPSAFSLISDFCRWLNSSLISMLSIPYLVRFSTSSWLCWSTIIVMSFFFSYISLSLKICLKKLFSFRKPFCTGFSYSYFHLWKIFERSTFTHLANKKHLQKHWYFANVHKFKFYIQKTNFLIFIIFLKGIEINTPRIDIIFDDAQGTSFHYIRLFLKFWNLWYYVIGNFSSWV